MPATELSADTLRSDPRVAQARALLQVALREHSSQLTGVKPPHADRRVEYAELLEEFAQQRGGALFYKFLGSGLGNGVLVELADGSVKYDMISGIGVHPFGHSDPELLGSLVDAALSDTVMQGNLQQNVESQQLSSELLTVANAQGAELAHCFLTTSGAMANENALKILFQHRRGAGRMLAFSHAFAGRSIALAAITDKAAYRVGLPVPFPVDFIPFDDESSPQKSLSRTLAELRQQVARFPDAHAGMVLELIQGEGGYAVASRDFLHGLCMELRRLKIPIWFDEIQTFGRTSQPFAFQHFGLDEFADVVTVGKMTQVCATLFRHEVAPQPGLISQTFTGATSSIFAARHILQRLRDGGFFADAAGNPGRLQEMHSRFVSHFERLSALAPDRIRGPWGCGGMVAFTAFGGDAAHSKQLLMDLFDAGVIAFSAGDAPTRIRMLPPFGVLTDRQIDEVCEILERCLLENPTVPVSG